MRIISLIHHLDLQIVPSTVSNHNIALVMKRKSGCALHFVLSFSKASLSDSNRANMAIKKLPLKLRVKDSEVFQKQKNIIYIFSQVSELFLLKSSGLKFIQPALNFQFSIFLFLPFAYT